VRNFSDFFFALKLPHDQREVSPRPDREPVAFPRVPVARRAELVRRFLACEAPAVALDEGPHELSVRRTRRGAAVAYIATRACGSLRLGIAERAEERFPPASTAFRERDEFRCPPLPVSLIRGRLLCIFRAPEQNRLRRFSVAPAAPRLLRERLDRRRRIQMNDRADTPNINAHPECARRDEDAVSVFEKPFFRDCLFLAR